MQVSIPKLDFVLIKHDENEEENNNSEVKSCKRYLGMLLCCGMSRICFLAFVNVMYVTWCNGIKSGIVIRFEEIAFHSEIMAAYILGYDVISIRVHQYLPRR